MIDFHCHLDLYPDFARAVEERENAKIYTLSVTTTPLAWEKNKELTQHTRYVRAALGLHPQLVSERSAEIELWEQHLSETRYIGEVGLDAGPRYKSSLSLQENIFAEILQSCARMGDKILSIHSVRAAKNVLDLLNQHLPPERGRVVLHWFTGSKKEIQRAIESGCYFSFNADMLGTSRGREIVAMVPLERILTETDAPFTKVPRIEPAVELLAQAFDVKSTEILSSIENNLKRLLRNNA